MAPSFDFRFLFPWWSSADGAAQRASAFLVRFQVTIDNCLSLRHARRVLTDLLLAIAPSFDRQVVFKEMAKVAVPVELLLVRLCIVPPNDLPVVEEGQLELAHPILP